MLSGAVDMCNSTWPSKYWALLAFSYNFGLFSKRGNLLPLIMLNIIPSFTF